VVAQLEAGGLDRNRLGRAVTVLLVSDILETETLGVYQVQSSCQPDVGYMATSAPCDCPDATQRGQTCKHQLAITILSAVSAVQARERAEALASARRRGPCDDALDLDVDAPLPFELTPRAYAALAEGVPPAALLRPRARQASTRRARASAATTRGVSARATRASPSRPRRPWPPPVSYRHHYPADAPSDVARAIWCGDLPALRRRAD
jgi:hypothetical protein